MHFDMVLHQQLLEFSSRGNNCKKKKIFTVDDSTMLLVLSFIHLQKFNLTIVIERRMIILSFES
jgi:hypothetical protein